jgi:prevent-host-death family protein
VDDDAKASIELTESCYVATRGHMKKSKIPQALREQKKLTSAVGAVEEAAAEVLRRRTMVSVREAKDQLSSLLARAAEGEEIVITSDGEPKAMLVRHRPVVGGKPWKSIDAFRATLPAGPDSAAMLREMRDSEY